MNYDDVARCFPYANLQPTEKKENEKNKIEERKKRKVVLHACDNLWKHTHTAADSDKKKIAEHY